MSMENMSNRFVGRQEEIKFLEEWLPDTSRPAIVYIHDETEDTEKKGGIGKTWLLQYYHEQIEKEHTNYIPVIINFFDILDRNGVVIATRVVQAVRKKYPYWQAEKFEKTLREYQEMVEKQRTEGLAAFRERLAEALANDLRMLHQVMLESDTFIVLFCDTFELIAANPVTAVLQSGRLFPELYDSQRVRVIIAGRDALDWQHPNWIGRGREVLVRPLPPFNYDEMVEYFQTRSQTDTINNLSPEVLRTLHERTEGRPILVGLVTDVLNNRILEPEGLISIAQKEFEASLVKEINHFGDPRKWVLFAMAHIFHRFDAAFLEHLLQWPGLKEYRPEIHYQELAQELKTLSFVRHAGSGDFVLHDEMRRLVNRHCWSIQDPDSRMRCELSNMAIAYYTKLIDLETGEDKRHSYIVERLYHELFFNRTSGFRAFERYFTQAIDFSQRAFARALLQELQKFEPGSPDEEWAGKLAEVRVLREEENYRAALVRLRKLEQEGNYQTALVRLQRLKSEENRPAALAHWQGLDPEENHPIALAQLQELEQDAARIEDRYVTLKEEEGKCYLRLSEYAQAITCFEACLQTEQVSKDQVRYEELLGLLGYVCRLQGRYANARHYYERALNVQRHMDNPGKYANMLNNVSYALHLQGKPNEALRLCKLALRSRRDLFKQRKIGEYDVALSLSTLGHIYHTLGEVSEEEKAYKEAFDIYNRVGHRRGIAASYNNLGRVWVRKEEPTRALLDFQQALRIAEGIHRPVEIESHNQLGRLALRQEEWEEARAHFERAVELARLAGMNFEVAENLLYLAQAMDHLARSSSALIQEVKRIARTYNFTYLLARAREIQGDMCLRKREYLAAFKHYSVSCRYLAERNVLEFERSLRKLNDNLLDIPSDYLPGVIDVLRSYWSEEGLDKTYPQLPAACKEVSRHMRL